MARALALLLCFALLFVASSGDDDDDGGAGSSGGGEASAQAEADGSPRGQESCREVQRPEPKPDGGAKRPSGGLDPSRTYRAVPQRSCGDVTIRLDQKTSPKTAGTSGSQFYIVTAPDVGLPPDYAVLGGVVKGIDVALAIEQLGDPASGGAGTPVRTVLLEKASIDES